MTNYTQSARALQHLDLSAEFAEIDRLATEERRINAAREAGREKIQGLAAQKAQLKASGPDGASVADALLSGSKTPVTHPELIDREIEAIRAGLNELGKQADAIRAEHSGAQSLAASTLAQAVASTIEPARQRIAAAAAVLAEEFAAAKAISAATRSSNHAALARELEEAVAHLHQERFLTGHRIEVPAGVTEMLAPAAESIEALGNSIVESIAVPPVHSDMALGAVVAHRSAKAA